VTVTKTYQKTIVAQREIEGCHSREHQCYGLPGCDIPVWQKHTNALGQTNCYHLQDIRKWKWRQHGPSRLSDYIISYPRVP